MKPTGTNYGQGHNFGQNLKTNLDSLVTAGTITQAQEDAVTSAMQSGTRGDFKNKLDAQVTNGTISQDQETAIENALKPTRTSQGHNFGQNLKTNLDSLVTAGTITQAQEDAAISTLQANANCNSVSQ